MKHTKKHTAKRSQKRFRFGVLTVTALLLTVLTASCKFKSSKSYTFSIENGDQIKVTLDTSDGYALSQKDGVFSVTSQEETILEGVFLLEETYEQYMGLSETTDSMAVLEEDERNDVSYLFYQFVGEAGMENNFIIFVKGSHTGVLIGSLSGQDAAKTAFDHLSFSCE